MNLLNNFDDLELYNVLQKTSLVNIKFSGIDNYIAVAVLFSNENILDVMIDLKKIRYIIEYSEEVQIKFIKDGYEFLLDGEITEVSTEEPVTATIKLIRGKRFLNKRRYIRYDTEEDGVILSGSDRKTICKIKNLSLGGAMVYCNSPLRKEDIIELKSGLFGNGDIKIAANVVRCIAADNDAFCFGLEFVNFSTEIEMALRKALLNLEREYLMNLSNLKQIKGVNNNLTSRVAVFDLCVHEELDVKEALCNLGIMDYTVFHDFKVYTDYFMEENPKLIIINSDDINEGITDEINAIFSVFPKTNIILVLPIQNIKVKFLTNNGDNKINLVYKPLIHNELEELIKKGL